MLNSNIRQLFNACFISLASFSFSIARAQVPAVPASQPVLVFDDTVPKNQSRVLQNDLLILKQLNFSDSDLTGAKLFGREMNGSNMSQWLSERSHYVIPESFSYEKSVKVAQPGYQFPNEILPDLEAATRSMKDSKNKNSKTYVMVVMSNVGAGVYIDGKRKKSLMSVNVSGVGDVKVNSPRAGIFKMGEGMFKPLLEDPDSYGDSTSVNSFNSFANSVWRLGIFFHEARHSDGNAKSLTFPHAVCPPGTIYAGFNACDRNLNGPYTVGGTFLKKTVDTCSKCTSKEKEALRNVYADSFSRVLKNALTPVAKAPNTDNLADSCDSMKKLGVDTSSLPNCNNPATTTPPTKALPAVPPLVLPLGVFDDTPEVGAL